MDKGFAVLEIDPEFKTLIRPLRKDEYLQLEVNLAVDGCREPIITWNNIIVDGHNRYEICNRLHIPYAIREMTFENREQAIVWICSNQLGRRNITEETRRYLIGKQYELEKVARKHPPNINGFNQYKRRNKGARGETFRRTAQKFSAQYNVSTGSVQKYAIFSKALGRPRTSWQSAFWHFQNFSREPCGSFENAAGRDQANRDKTRRPTAPVHQLQ